MHTHVELVIKWKVNCHTHHLSHLSWSNGNPFSLSMRSRLPRNCSPDGDIKWHLLVTSAPSVHRNNHSQWPQGIPSLTVCHLITQCDHLSLSHCLSVSGKVGHFHVKRETVFYSWNDNYLRPMRVNMISHSSVTAVFIRVEVNILIYRYNTNTHCDSSCHLKRWSPHYLLSYLISSSPPLKLRSERCTTL